MKKQISFVILLLLLLPLTAYPQWVSQSLPGGIRVTLGIDFINQNHGITGGWSGDFTTQINGRAYYTTNGGVNWIQASIPGSTRVFVNVAMINDNLCYGAGAYNLSVSKSSSETYSSQTDNLSPSQKVHYEKLGMDFSRQEDYRGYFLESTNGGAAWHPKGTFDNSVYYLTGISFINDQTGFVIATSLVASTNAILKTTDSGNNWYYVYPFEEYLTIEDIKFLDELHGIAVGETTISPESGVILLTADGGETWIKYYNNQLTSIFSVAYLNADFLVAGGINSNLQASVIKSSDGGLNWEEIHNYNGPYFIDGVNALYNTNYILIFGTYIDPGNILFVDISTDGGNNWNSNIFSQFQNYIPTYSKMVNLQRWYITGTNNAVNGFVLFTDNSGGVPVELTSFTAENTGGRVLLKWETATETNNSGFMVERSRARLPAKQKSEVGPIGLLWRSQNEWTKIGYIEGNGTTTQSHSYSFIDENVQPGKYQYRLKQMDFDGSFEYSAIVEVEVAVPGNYVLEQNYPNPFNPATTINYSIPENSFVVLKVYNLLGKELKTLVNEVKQPGNYSAEFNAADLASGVYIYKLECEKYYSVKKMLLIR